MLFQKMLQKLNFFNLLKKKNKENSNFLEFRILEKNTTNREKLQNIIYHDVAEKIFETQNLSTRLINTLKKAKIFQIKDILSFSERQISLLPQMGDNSLRELKNFLLKNGIILGKNYQIIDKISPQKKILESEILSFEEFVSKNYDPRTTLVILERYNGKTLEQVAKNFNLTRERIRQICNKLNWKKWDISLREDKYLPIFRTYNWEEVIFCKVFQEKKSSFNYLNHRYGKGKKPLHQSLEDDNLSTQQKHEITSFLNNQKSINRIISKEDSLGTSITIQFPENLLKKCRYCGESFIPTSGRQEVCKNPSCQKKRNADNMRKYLHRKKLNKQI